MPSRRTLLRAMAGLGLSSQTPARAQAPVPVRVGYVPVIGAGALFVLDGAGWAAEAGLAPRLTRFDSGPAAIQALASATLDVLAIGVAPIAVARAKGLDVRIVSAAALGGAYLLAVPALAEALAAGPAEGFRAFRARAGRPAKLATLPPGAVPTASLHHWLRRVAGVDLGDVQIVTLGIEAVQQAMLSGAVDGATVLEPSATIVRARRPDLRPVVTMAEMLPGVPGVAVAATGAFARAQPAALERLVGLVDRATALIRAEPEAAAPHVQRVLGGGLVDAATFAAALRSPAVAFVTDLRAIVEPTRRLLAFQGELGDFETAPPTEGLFDTAFWDRATGRGG